jgi:hypothetical protein
VNRSQIIMLVAVLGMATFYFWSKLHKLETEEREYQAKRYFPEKKEEDIESISVTCTDPNFAYVLRRNGDRWYLDGHLASQEKSPQLVNSLIELSTEKEILATPRPEDDKEFGLDNPTYTIALTGNGGADLGTVLLGNRTPGANHFYGRWQKGGVISTVPAYTLSPLEEEPKDLRENSPFPVEVNAVDRFEFAAGTEKGKLQRPEGKDEGFEIVEPNKAGGADETRVSELMYLLKDLKVARFLEESEKTDLGAPVATYRAHEVESKVDLVTEFCQPVAVTPRFRYGRRYLTDPGQAEPRPGTEERFVIEVLEDSKALQASVSAFEDRRVQKLDVDKVKLVKLTLADGSKLSAQRLPQGGWRFTEPAERVDEADPGQRVDKLLWALRDLRYADSKVKVDPSIKGQWQVELEMSDGQTDVFGFGADKSGKPYVGFGNKSLLLQEDLVPALDDAAKALSVTPGTATPTPAPSPVQ